ncbi:MAG: competence/damage-inducible protein A [Verrucomicrobiae bacterium]|nr:competence/damage-inducible protein A [Verrucomicrobiae bacterium]
MNVELINTGSELMLGRVLNSHQRWLCRRLADIGRPVTRQVAVADTAVAIGDAVSEGLRRAELVITTGGLGPTADDVTRERVAGLLGRRLVENADARAGILAFFAARGRAVPDRVLVQALVPEGATVLPNANGTAPGLAIGVEEGRFGPHAAWLIMLPGPPRELYPMFDGQVLPLLPQVLPPSVPFHCVTLRTTGLGESWVEEQLDPHLASWRERGLEIGYCARTGEVDVRLVARGAEGAALVGGAAVMVREQLGPAVYGTGDEAIESAVIALAANRGARLTVAESCTGGLLAHRLTNVPGASAVFWGGWIAYDNQAKQGLLGVDAALLREQGAVSEACAAAMAEGALARAGATHAVAITGIAGPSGGSPEKPVGTVYIGLAQAGRCTEVLQRLHPYDRETFKQVTTQHALDALRRRLLP